MSEASTRVDELLSHAGWLRGLACRLVGEAGADDAVQEVWLKAARRPTAAVDSPRGWLWSALRSVHLRQTERQRAAAARERAAGREGPRAEALGEGLPSAEQMAERAEAQRLLVEAVLQLEEPDRQSVLLHFFEGLSAAEISRRSGVPSSTVRTRIARGVASLRERLDRGAAGWAGGRAVWLPAVSLLTPPSGGVIIPTILTAGTVFMWKLGVSLVALALVAWTGVHFLGGDSGGAVPPPPQGGGAATELASGFPGDALPDEDGEPSALSAERAPAGIAAAPSEDKEPAGDASTSESPAVVVGRVVDPSAQPVPGAMVFEGTLAQVGMARRISARPQLSSTNADEGGRFRLELKSPDGAILCARAEGFASSDQFFVEPARSSAGNEITIRLREGATVTGVVYGKDKQPIVGRKVTLSSSGLGAYRTAVTGEEGRYTVGEMVPGPWRASTFPSNQELIDAGESTEPASAVAQLKQAEFTLVDGQVEEVLLGFVSLDAPHVDGVLKCNGKPIGGLMQWYPAARHSEKMVSRANEQGKFEIDLPSPGDWIVHVNAAGESSRGQRQLLTFAAGERRELEIDLRGGSIFGRVVDPQGEPIKGVRLELRTVGVAPHLPHPTMDGGSGWSDREGNYKFGLLMPGAYVVVAHGTRPESKRDKRGTARSEVIEIAGTGDAEAPLLVLRDGVSFVVKVHDSSGRTVSGASIYFHDADGYSVNPSTQTRSSKIGTISPGFAPGPVWVTATHQSGASNTASVNVGSDAEVVLVIAGEHWIELDGGTEWIDETSGYLSVIDGDMRRWAGLVDISRLFEARPVPDDPRGPLIGPLPLGRYRVTYQAPGGTARHGAVDLESGSPQVSAVLLR